MKWKYPTNTPTYNSWKAMRYRVANSKTYKDKDIKICEAWKSYDNFFEDMGERPESTTIDRIDNKGNYCKENCRWADIKTQQNNKEFLTEILYNGETLTIGQWVTRLGLNKRQRNTVYKRHTTYGASSFEELFTPKRLHIHRLDKRKNECTQCGTKTTCKWRKHGKQCNTCWHREYRK
jgi:hypothetical protein